MAEGSVWGGQDDTSHSLNGGASFQTRYIKYLKHHVGYLYFISAAFVSDTEIFVVSWEGRGGAMLGVGSTPTCLCTRARLSEDISSAVQPEQKVAPAARVGVFADEFMFN